MIQIALLKREEAAVKDYLRDRWYIFEKRSRFREYWDYIVMFLAIYNCCWTPLTISFDWADRQEDDNIYLKTIDYGILAIYSADILIQFLTSYYNVTTGEGPITKPSMIAKRYVFSFDFLLDVLSTIPFRYYEPNNEKYEAFA